MDERDLGLPNRFMLDGEMLSPLVPCIIHGPLDCFWEGAKVIGPEKPVHIPIGETGRLTWKNFDTEKLKKIIETVFNDNMDAFEKYGIRGYIHRPCLNASDPECPAKPNKTSSSHLLDNIPGHLNNGCKGLAEKVMHWPRQQLVGGFEEDENGTLVSAEAFQTIFQLMGEQDMFDFYEGKSEIIGALQGSQWTLEAARTILVAWERKFAEVAQKAAKNYSDDEMLTWTGNSHDDVMHNMTSLDPLRLSIAFGTLLIHVALSQLRLCSYTRRSQFGVTVCGLLLVCLSVAAGLGATSVLNIYFTPLSTQVVPFLSLALGVDDLFVLTHTLQIICRRTEIARQHRIGELLRQAGLGLILASASNMTAFFAAALIPIPTLHHFALQMGVLLLFCGISALLIYPTLLALDLRRQDANRMDLLCCRKHSSHDTNQNTPVNRAGSVPSLPPPYTERDVYSGYGGSIGHITNPAVVQRLISTDECSARSESTRSTVNEVCCDDLLNACTTRCYSPLIAKLPTKVMLVIVYASLVAAAVMGSMRLQHGMSVWEVVPRATPEYRAIKTLESNFGLQHLFVTFKSEGFDFEHGQNELNDLYERLQNLQPVYPLDSSPFWLHAFRSWLEGLQREIDEANRSGILIDGRAPITASDRLRLATTLLAQTSSNQLDYNQTSTKRLVQDGIILPSIFYKLLAAWHSEDPLTYYSTFAEIRPKIREITVDFDKPIVAAEPIIFVRLQLFMSQLTTAEKTAGFIQEVRDILSEFEGRGLVTFLEGLPVTWVEQPYLPRHLAICLGVMAALVVIIAGLLACPRSVVLLLLSVGSGTACLVGAMGWLGIRFNAVSVCVVVVCSGFTAKSSILFLSTLLREEGSPSERVSTSLRLTLRPIIHAAISTVLLMVTALADSQLDFILWYVLSLVCSSTLIALLFAVVFLPAVLAATAPPTQAAKEPQQHRSVAAGAGEVIVEQDWTDRAARRQAAPRSKRSRCQGLIRTIPSQLSLTTITEEPSNYASSTPDEGGSSGVDLGVHKIVLDSSALIPPTQTEKPVTPMFVPMPVPPESYTQAHQSSQRYPVAVQHTIPHQCGITCPATHQLHATATPHTSSTLPAHPAYQFHQTSPTPTHPSHHPGHHATPLHPSHNSTPLHPGHHSALQQQHFSDIHPHMLPPFTLQGVSESSGPHASLLLPGGVKLEAQIRFKFQPQQYYAVPRAEGSECETTACSTPPPPPLPPKSRHSRQSFCPAFIQSPHPQLITHTSQLSTTGQVPNTASTSSTDRAEGALAASTLHQPATSPALDSTSDDKPEPVWEDRVEAASVAGSDVVSAPGSDCSSRHSGESADSSGSLVTHTGR